MGLPEFDLIARLQEIISLPEGLGQAPCALGIGDDAAVLDVPPDRQLVVCTDTLVEGVHFPVDTPPGAIGHKALAVNLSDLAAMGAEPAWFFMALTLPHCEPSWTDAFAGGVAELAREAGIVLAGGDVASGPLNICITAAGLLEQGTALTRSGARPGDLVVVSGTPGSAARALACLQNGKTPTLTDLAALRFPRPRLALGRALRGVATSCIDLSDGLAADLGHILEQSSVGAELDLGALPCPASLESLPPGERWNLQLGGGDDYELCFTLDSGQGQRIEELASKGEAGLTVIGKIRAEKGLALKTPDGSDFQLRRAGFQHFENGGKAR
jgi:thiamine-monophosphate kinase